MVLIGQYTREQASSILEEMKKLAKEYPNAEYKPQIYGYKLGKVENGPVEEGCIVGQAIRRLSLPFPSSNYHFSMICEDKDLGKEIGGLQNYQDRGTKWGRLFKTE